MDPKKKMAEIIRRLRREYPDTKTGLNFTSPFELLAATVFSAQTTDVLVNRVTQGLFKKYRNVKEYAHTSPEELAEDIRPVNFYKTKAKNIHASAQIIVEKFRGEVPKTMDELVSLPGVARKTANIVLWNAFGINEGIAVDTHVKRLAGRLGLTGHDDPVKIEIDLMRITLKKEWGIITHLLIEHGRKVCQARKPNHQACVLYDLCPSSEE